MSAHLTEAQLIAQTRAWVEQVVVKYNFCPFAKPEVVHDRIRYQVFSGQDLEPLLAKLEQEYQYLEQNSACATTLLIVPMLESFTEYLAVLQLLEQQLEKAGYEGVFQLASFHPEYVFADAEVADPANYTNRSPYPTFHILREASLSVAIDQNPWVDDIPARNIDYTRRRGEVFWQRLLTEIKGEAGSTKN